MIREGSMKTACQGDDFLINGCDAIATGTMRLSDEGYTWESPVCDSCRDALTAERDAATMERLVSTIARLA